MKASNKEVYVPYRDFKGRFMKLPELETAEHMPDSKLYFGYGSNLDMFSMKRRCPDSIPVCAAVLPDYRLTFSGVLTIEPDCPGESVYGAIYEVSHTDEGELDIYEGYPHLYIKRFTHVTVAGVRREVFYYVMPKGSYSVAPPGAGYYEVCEQGYLDWGLDVALLQASRKRAWSQRKDFYATKTVNTRYITEIS